jgi:hypothetical protein
MKSPFMRSMALARASLMPQLRNSCMAMMGRPPAKPAKVPKELDRRIEEIREWMLEQMGTYGERSFPAVARRIRYSPDVQGLWYARSDVMAILATTHGETVARQKIADLSSRFMGLMPDSLTKRAFVRSR